MTLKDKKVLIVGGGSGLGLSVAKAASQEGAKILIASRHAKDRHEYLIDAINQNIETYSFDITSDAQTERLLTEIGNIDHLVIAVRPPQPESAAFPDLDIGQVKLAFETKFWGQFQLIQKACRQINRNGSVILTTGIAGERIYKGAVAMAVINAASEVLCRSLAVEIAPVRVNAVSPGFIAPKPDNIEKFAMQFPSGSVGQPEDVSGAYLYLLNNPYVTGATVVVDGGARLI